LFSCVPRLVSEVEIEVVLVLDANFEAFLGLEGKCEAVEMASSLYLPSPFLFPFPFPLPFSFLSSSLSLFPAPHFLGNCKANRTAPTAKASHLRGYFGILIASLLAIPERISRMLDQKDEICR
jgi:hypothetical protein